MDYVKEVSLFYDWMELNPLSPSATNLWNALLHIHYKTGWQESFAVNEMVLCLKTNLSGRTLRKARAELKEKGRLDFISQKGKAPTYTMIPFQSQISKRRSLLCRKRRYLIAKQRKIYPMFLSIRHSVQCCQTEFFPYNKQQQKHREKDVCGLEGYFNHMENSILL